MVFGYCLCYLILTCLLFCLYDLFTLMLHCLDCLLARSLLFGLGICMVGLRFDAVYCCGVVVCVWFMGFGI